MATDSEPISYSIVIPVFNEEAVLPVLLRRLDQLLARLSEPAEAIFVDDGSSDSGPFVLQALAKRDPRFRYIGLSRNFGHQVAITAGMDAAQGNAIIVMDADLQDPPEIVEQLIAKLEGRLRRRPCAPSVACGRKPFQARHRPFVLSAARQHVFGRHPRRCRRLSPD
jgi:glycosyltransferase involved in cell wall biosynthesis